MFVEMFWELFFGTKWFPQISQFSMLWSWVWCVFNSFLLLNFCLHIEHPIFLVLRCVGDLCFRNPICSHLKQTFRWWFGFYCILLRVFFIASQVIFCIYWFTGRGQRWFRPFAFMLDIRGIFKSVICCSASISCTRSGSFGASMGINLSFVSVWLLSSNKPSAALCSGDFSALLWVSFLLDPQSSHQTRSRHWMSLATRCRLSQSVFPLSVSILHQLNLFGRRHHC